MNITEFVLARIAEDERRAEGSGTVAWLTFRGENGAMRYTTVAASDHAGGWLVNGEQVEDYADCTVIYSESQRLAECASKRALISAFDPHSPELDPFVGRDVIAMLAAVYKEHPDYKQEWQ